jgi:acetylornithine/succinyldiaminopimelate/putrescine aminotransferase
VAYNDVRAIEAAVKDTTCAVLLEPIQGEGGVIIPHEGYLKEVRNLCDERGLLLILDEVQTGCGRTGTLWGHEQFGVKPDIMTVGKGLGGGVPIAGIVVKDRAACFGPGDHGSTFGGNALCSAVACSVLHHILEQDLPGNAARVGSYFRDRLVDLQEKYEIIKAVRGRGLLVALEFAAPVALPVVQACRELGLLGNALPPQTIRFMPPLNIHCHDVDQAIAILEIAIGQICPPLAGSSSREDRRRTSVSH